MGSKVRGLHTLKKIRSKEKMLLYIFLLRFSEVRIRMRFKESSSLPPDHHCGFKTVSTTHTAWLKKAILQPGNKQLHETDSESACVDAVRTDWNTERLRKTLQAAHSQPESTRFMCFTGRRVGETKETVSWRSVDWTLSPSEDDRTDDVSELTVTRSTFDGVLHCGMEIFAQAAL